MRIITFAFRSNLVVNFEKKGQFFLELLLSDYVCLTGIGENLAETPIFKDSSIFAENGDCFEKGWFLVEILNFLKVSFVFEEFIFGGIVFFW